MYLDTAIELKSSAHRPHQAEVGLHIARSRKSTCLNFKAGNHRFRKNAPRGDQGNQPAYNPSRTIHHGFEPTQENAHGTNEMAKNDFIKELQSSLSHYFPVHTLVCSTTFKERDQDEINTLLTGVQEILIGLQALTSDHKSSLHVQCSKRGIEFHLHSPQIVLNSEAELFPSFQCVVDLLASGSWSYTQEPSGKNGMFIALLTANSRPYDH